MTITRYANTPLNEFIRMIENKNSDSDILNECIVRLGQLYELKSNESDVQAIECPYCEGNFNVTVFIDDFKVGVKK